MQPEQELISKLTIFSKYARYWDELGRRETLEEIVARNRQMHLDHIQGLGKDSPELRRLIDWSFRFVYERKVFPSMRAFQFGGEAIQKNETRGYNCSFRFADEDSFFPELMFLLMSGTGVGYSVQKRHVAKLPTITTPGKAKTYVIPDSIEGWALAVRELYSAFFHGGPDPIFDYSLIRPEGAILVTSGGRAPGPRPLQKTLDGLRGILLSKELGTKLTPIEVHDMACIIARAVLSGGIRRSAMISLFSPDDEEMLNAKSGPWWETRPERAFANNSAVLLRGRDDELFWDIFRVARESGSGEPGILWVDDERYGTNPCAEITLNNKQFCVSGDTRLLTRDGVTRIEDAVGRDIEIWNGERWSQANPYITGTDDTLYRVEFSDGSYLDATANHKFLIEDTSLNRGVEEMETLEVIERLKAAKGRLRLPRANIVYEDGEHEEFAYEYGFFLGDGHIATSGRPQANIYANDKKLPLRGRKTGPYRNWNNTEYETVHLSDLSQEFSVGLKHSNGLPVSVFSWDRDSILRFVAGWADADGSRASKGIRIYGREDKIRDGQLLLTKVGIDSSVNLMAGKESETNLGTRRNAVWYLQITKTADIPCHRLVCDNNEPAKYKGKFQNIRSIRELPGRHMSYCLTENQNHQCVFNNVLTKQCNLTTINVGTIESQDDYNQRARAAGIIGTLQASYTNFPFLSEGWKHQTEAEALLGVSMTGIASGAIEHLDAEEAVAHVVAANKEVAALLGINPAARATAVKPEGTASLVAGTSSGIHAWHDKFYIRRMRFNKTEPIAKYLMARLPYSAESNDAAPEIVEDDVFNPHQIVVAIPQRAPEGAITRDEGALNLLERVKRYTREWIRPGNEYGGMTNNISATINIRDHEWAEVENWMWNNRYEYNGLSLLPYSDHSYRQPPFQSCDEDTFNRMKAKIEAAHIDLTEVAEAEDNTELSMIAACAGGACEWTP